MKATVFGCTKRGLESKSLVPGPGTYEVDGLRKIAPAFSCTPRRNLLTSTIENPGPGAHTLPGSLGSGPKHRFTSDGRGTKAGSFTPGPAEYNVVDSETKGPKWRLGTASRDQHSTVCTPGPGAYERPGSLGGPKFSAATKKEETRVVETPGPVTYTFRADMFGSSQKHVYSMSARHEKSTSLAVNQPGPGHYSARCPVRSAPMYGFGTSARHDPDKKKCRSPGPGAYSPASRTQSHMWRIPLANRGGLDDKRGLPGPGEYHATSPPRRTSPKYTLGSRHPSAGQHKRESEPGPGEYNQDLGVKPSPRWGFGTQARLSSSNNRLGPGPGTYAPHRELNGPKFGFPKSERRPLAKSDTPGPGAHGGVSTQFLP